MSEIFHSFLKWRNGTCYFSEHTKQTPKADNADDPILPGKAFYDSRRLTVEELKQNDDTHPYPHKFPISITLSDFCQKYDHLNKAERVDDVCEQVAGRILSIRRASSKLYFFDVQGEGAKIQVKVNLATYDNKDGFADEMSKFHRGDIVGIHGFPCRTKSGELSIDSKTVTSTDSTHSCFFTKENICYVSHFSCPWSFPFLDEIISSMFAYAANITL